MMACGTGLHNRAAGTAQCIDVLDNGAQRMGESPIGHKHMHSQHHRSQAGFVACMVLVYGATSEFLVIADAAMFNLSLLTSDLYAVIFAYFFTGKLVSLLGSTAQRLTRLR